MQLLPRLCMATATATGDGDGEGSGKGDGSSSSKLATAVSSSSSTVSTSSAAAAAVSEASSSSASLPSLSSAAIATLAASVVHVATLLPQPSESSASASAHAAAAVVAAADDGSLVVARPARVALHDASTLEPAAAGSVKCAAQLPGGACATVTGHQDGRLRLWRVSSRCPARLRLAASLPTVSDRLRRFPVPSNHVAVRRHHRRLWIEHADAVSGVAAFPGGRLLFSVSWDRTLKVWALPSLRCLQSLPAHDDAVNAVAAAPDGAVYTASADTRVRVWAPRRPEHEPKQPRRWRALGSRGRKQHGHPAAYHLVATLARHTAAVNALAVGCGGHALYSAGNDRCVLVWEREDSASHMAAVGALRGHRRAVLSVACAAGGLVVSGAADQTVRAWRRAADGRGYACVAVIEGHGAAVRSVAAAPLQKRPRGGDDDDGGGDEEWRVCSASFDGEVRVWSLKVSSGL